MPNANPPTERCAAFCGANTEFPYPCVGWYSVPGCGVSPENPRCVRRRVLEDEEKSHDEEHPWLDDSTQDNYL